MKGIKKDICPSQVATKLATGVLLESLGSINGRYELVRKLGAGAQGAVYEAEDALSSKRKIALKILAEGVPPAMLNFEFEQLSKMEHPHLVEVYDLSTVVKYSGSEAIALGSVFFTQELVAGVPAHAFIAKKRRNRFPSNVAKIAVAVARALAILHTNGLLHLDVKPSNILVGEKLQVKLIDLGLSRFGGTLNGLRAGTLGYIAPEIFGGVPDERSDLFGLGATLSHLLTGEIPKQGTPIPHHPPNEVPEDFWDVIKRLTSSEPEDRYHSAGETVLAIARAMGAEYLGSDEIDKEAVVDAATSSESKETKTSLRRCRELVGQKVERRRIVEWLKTFFSTEDGGNIALGVLVGAPGVGKTRLLRRSVIDVQIGIAEKEGIPPALMKGTLRDLAFTDKTESTVFSMEYPSVFLIEDGDSELASTLLERLARRHAPFDSKRLAVVFEMENEEKAKEVSQSLSAIGNSFLFVEICPLDLEDETKMVSTMLGRDPGREFLVELHRVTGGVPLLTEAVIAGLGNKGSSDKGWLKKIKALDLEGDSNSIVLAGLRKNLKGTARALVEVLAVAGGAISLNEILEITTVDGREDALDAMNNLLRRGWLDRDSAGRFTLPRLVAVTLRDSLSKPRLKRISAKALETLRKRERLDYVRLARLAANAGRGVEASRLAKEASKILKEAGDLQGAAKQLQLVIELGDAEQLDDTKTDLANILRRTGEYSRAVELTLDVERNGGELAPRAALERAAVLRLSGHLEEAIALLSTLMDSPRMEISAEARAIAARMELDRGEYKAARERIGQVQPKPDILSMRSGLLSTAGLIELSLGNTTKAQGLFRAGLEAATSDGDLQSRAKYHGLMGISYHHLGDWKSAYEHYGSALKHADASGDRHGAATYTINLAAACTELDKIKEALEFYRDGTRRLRSVGRVGELAQTGANYAQLLLRLGDAESADRVSYAAKQDLERTNLDSKETVFVTQVRADVLMALGETEEARSVLLKTLKMANGASSAACLELLCELDLSKGNAEGARNWLEKSKSQRCETGETKTIEQKRLELEVCLMGSGDTEKALRRLDDVLPKDSKKHRLVHLKAFSSLARGKLALGHKKQAFEAARAALEILSVFERSLPSLHRQGETALSQEMRGIMSFTTDNVSSKPDTDENVTSKDWKHLVRINNRLNSEFRIGRLFEYIMDTAIDITGAERGFLLIADPKGELHIRCARNIDRNTLTPGEHGYSHSVAKRALDLNEPVLTTNAQEDPRFQDMRSVLNLNLRYIAAVPLQVKGRTTGAIYLDSRGGAQFDDGRISLLKALADQAAIALTNARLTAENRRRQARIERLNRKLKSELESREGELEQVKEELARRTDELITRYKYREIVARSQAMEKIFSLLDKVVDSNLPVVVVGDSGTGKELVARALHFNGPRRRKPFVAENCGAIPETLLETVLFGHVRGAYTGAHQDSRGLFVEAHGGTLFLDEVSSMPPSMQVKLLRVLQDGAVRPVGGGKATKVDVRIVVASNTELADMVKEGAFREDLYYRLNVVSMKLPPLKERKEDIPLLAGHFTEKHIGSGVTISKETMEVLLEYPWPGNVRQLENEIMRAGVLCNDTIEVRHLSEEILNGIGAVPDSITDLDMNRQVERLKKRMIEAALSNTGGNQSGAATLLGVSRYGLQKMMVRFGITAK